MPRFGKYAKTAIIKTVFSINKQKNKMKKINHALLLILLILITSFGKEANCQKSIIGFYNCENFYDTTNQANVTDEDFLPESVKGYNRKAYDSKSKNLARVLYALGNLENANGLAILGVVEIENKIVLSKLLEDPLLKKHHYKYVHFDSKDLRGIDVALIYNPAKFKPYQFRPYSLTDETHFTDYATRDILYVTGLLENEWVHILVNHWPSRRGGEKISTPKRLWAASVCKRIMDSVQKNNPTARWIVMGDFNDNPTDKSLRMLGLQNPFLLPYRKGMGTLAYNDSWNLFDQILISPNWVKELPQKKGIPKGSYLNYCKPVIYKNNEMIETQGRYKGYPRRTYNGNNLRGGYSDHFPVALIFSLKNDKNEPK